MFCYTFQNEREFDTTVFSRKKTREEAFADIRDYLAAKAALWPGQDRMVRPEDLEVRVAYAERGAA